MNPSPLTSSYLPSPSLRADRFVCQSSAFAHVTRLCASTFFGVQFGLVGFICTGTATYPAHASPPACGGALKQGLREASELFQWSSLVSRSKVGRRVSTGTPRNSHDTVWLFHYANIGGLASCYAKRCWILKTHKPCRGWKWFLAVIKSECWYHEGFKSPAFSNGCTCRNALKNLQCTADTTPAYGYDWHDGPCIFNVMSSVTLLLIGSCLCFFFSLRSQWDPGKKVWIHHLHGGGAQ